jgi:ubiquitin carboxyl-terminal hydrolase 16/45
MLGRKYDQYLDFRQQDAHEFLRLLLDAMRMEELDVREHALPPNPFSFPFDHQSGN